MVRADNVYDSPDHYGLELVGDAQWGEANYDFAMTAVWRHKMTGQLYWADDAGCSCPSPFEDFQTVEQLESATKHEVLAHLNERENANPGSGMDLIERIASLA